jgi:GNAT superfamily N-acetyltransferase
VSVIKFNYDIPLEETMAFESVYHYALQLDLSEKKEMWDAPGSIFVWLFVDGELAGESYGIPLASCDEPIEGLNSLTEGERRTGIYCYSNTILPSFQKQGFGSILKSHWLGLAAGKGFNIVYGHARPGGSQALNTKFGAIFLGGVPDWYGTGEEYRMYRLALNAPQ